MSGGEDNTSHLEESKIDRQLRGRDGGGASILVKDPRVSRVLSWFWSALGTAFVAGVYWVGSSINSLNENVTRILTQNDAIIHRVEYNEGVNERQDTEIRSLENRVGVIDGRMMRGPSEATRGH